MFGIIRPCRHSLSEHLRTEWMAHLCGMCLALRDDHGHAARVATNYDGLIISVLVEAQARPEGEGGTGRRRRKAGPCALRGMRPAEVSRGDGARLAAAVSLVLASAKMQDHVDDGDGVFARRGVAGGARKVAARWARQGADTAGDVGFDTAVMVDAVRRQTEIEARPRFASVLEITEPTETATAAAFAHTAVLAGRPGNEEPLAEAGRLFGRLAHLLDAVEDAWEDRRTGAWNPLLATGTSPMEAHRLCRDAAHGIRLALRDVTFPEGALVHRLLVHEVDTAIDRSFGHAGIDLPGRKGHGACGTRGHRHEAPAVSGSADPGAAGPPSGLLMAAPGTLTTPEPTVAPDAVAPDAAGGAEAADGGAVGSWPGQAPPAGPGTGNPFGPQQPGGPGWDPNNPGWNPPPGGGGPGRGPRRGAIAGCMVWIGLCCTCQVCCRESFPDPCTGEPREGACHKCDGCSDCCDACSNCCDCCNCCGGDGCDCGCDCGC